MKSTYTGYEHSVTTTFRKQGADMKLEKILTEDAWIVMRLLVSAANDENGRKLLIKNLDYTNAISLMQDKYGEAFDQACLALNQERKEQI